MDKSLVVIGIGIILFVGTAAFLSAKKQPEQVVSTPGTTVLISPSTSQPATATIATKNLVDPVKDFKQRVTKKFFGTYVTPNNSPVQPEKFTGYHTGADAEYGDVAEDVAVYAIADGTVLLARWASGYGGVIAIQHEIN
ncbi:MAG TPA: hypothetical protein VLG69_02270, partial [Candidatus Andersenbacteria bacterium]|nr:hypothetical protein [Candidatus Andersenbacteria bacterium]